MGRELGEEDEAELPEIRRQTPVNDGIPTSPKAPARLADGLEVEGPPPDIATGYAPGETRLATGSPAPRWRGADSALSSIRRLPEHVKDHNRPADANITTSEWRRNHGYTCARSHVHRGND